MIQLYSEGFSFVPSPVVEQTQFSVVDNDTFTTAAEFDHACCLNFASHKRPGGGYESVRNLRMPIRTQEEDLFRRSNLPELLDIPEIHKYYPLPRNGLDAIYCSNVVVNKDKQLDPVDPYSVAVISMPAVVNPEPKDTLLIVNRIRRILEIAAVHNHKHLILGAWGCGIFNNSPAMIATTFKVFLKGGEFDKVFENVVFAIPGKDSENHKIFQDIIA
ncbi:MAG: TIGR02452 family protein [Proteobacteria bacterium]|jgi:uncharacterized protein (TIGR02452 family)|nr:TIGR02452 family protein [Pseudomonadota bacterium]